MLLGERPSTRAPDPTEALIREARQRQRRRWALIATVLLVVGGLTYSVVGGDDGGSDRDRARPARPDRAAPVQQPPAPPVPVPGQLNRPHSLAVDIDGSLLIVNEGTSQILRRRLDGKLEVVAGTGVAGYSGDGGPATEAQISAYAYGIAVGANGTIYFADTSNNAIRAISVDGIISTVVAPEALHGQPNGVDVASDGSLYFGDEGGIHRRFQNGVITTVVAGGPGALPLPKGPTYFGPSAVAVDDAGNIYAANFSPKQLIEFSPEGAIEHVWELYVSFGGLVGTSDGVVIANYGYTIERVRDGKLSTEFTFANTIPGTMGFRPLGVAVGADGALYAADVGASGGNDVGVIIQIDSASSAHVLETH